MNKIKRGKVLHTRCNLGSHKLQVGITEEIQRKRESSLWKQEAVKGMKGKYSTVGTKKLGFQPQHPFSIPHLSLLSPKVQLLCYSLHTNIP